MRRIRVLAFAAILLACLAAPRRASASDWMPEFNGGDVLGVALVGGAVLVTDIVFTVHDAKLESRGLAPERGWAIAETAVGGLQTIGAVAIYWSIGASGYDDASLSIGLLPVTWIASLGVHGVWGLAAPETRPSLLLAGSYAVAADSLLTAWSLRRAVGGHLASSSHAIMELVLTAPQVALATYGAATTSSSAEHAGLIALASWSGALFFHGALSLAWPSKEPSPPTTPAPEASAPTVAFTPTVLRTATSSVPGMEIRGVF